MKSILFVCHGNICRSPLAEGILRHLANDSGLTEELLIDSAGIIAFHSGEPPDSRMKAVAQSHGISLNGTARQFREQDFDNQDLILAMDSSNYSSMYQLANNDEERAKIRMFLFYDPEQGDEASVPDPYYGERTGFENVFNMTMRGCEHIVSLCKTGKL